MSTLPSIKPLKQRDGHLRMPICVEAAAAHPALHDVVAFDLMAVTAAARIADFRRRQGWW